MPEARFFRRGVWVMVQDLQPGDLLIGDDNRLCTFRNAVNEPSGSDVYRLYCEQIYKNAAGWLEPETIVEIAVPEITFEQYRASLTKE